jgi:hypothetical protein
LHAAAFDLLHHFNLEKAISPLHEHIETKSKVPLNNPLNNPLKQGYEVLQ